MHHVMPEYVICVPVCSFCIINGAVLPLGERHAWVSTLDLIDKKQSYSKQCMMEDLDLEVVHGPRRN